MILLQLFRNYSYASAKSGFCLLLILLSFCKNHAAAQTSICHDINKVTLPFSPGQDAAKLSYLDSLLAGVDILALGESTHGTSDFFKSKFLIIQYCVTNLNFRSIGIEADFTGTQYVNQYISRGTGSVKEAVYQMGITAWMTDEMKEIIDWLKAYNRDRADYEKVYFYGFDMQFSRPSIEALQLILANHSEIEPSSLPYLDTILSWKTAKEVNRPGVEKFAADISRLTKNLKSEEQAKVNELLMILEQSMEFKAADDHFDMRNIRDKYMADNIQLMFRRNNCRSIIWAHNEHIAKSNTIGKWKQMGQFLNEQFKNRYYALGLMTSEGYFGFYNSINKTGDSLPIPEDNKKNSYENIFSLCNIPAFYIDIKAASRLNASVSELLNEVNQTRTIDLIYNKDKQKYQLNNNYFKNSLSSKFDGIIYIRNTNASKHGK